MRGLRHFCCDKCHHLISRIARRAFFLTEEERTRFVDLLWRVASFSEVEVLAYCFMTNHFHLLVYVPPPRELSDDELLMRIRALYCGPALARIEEEWSSLLASVSGKERTAFRGRFARRMMSVAAYIDRNPIKAGLIILNGVASRFSPVKQFALTPKGRRLADA